MKIDYTITETYKNIFEIEIPDAYDLSMLFWRAQEYYESNNPTFRGKKFSIWDYMKWYTQEKGSFSYATDWEGFNLPFEVAKKCYAWSAEETPYDKIMREILQDIKEMKKDDLPAYIIGFTTGDKKTYMHEICHALYFTNPKYKAEVTNVTHSIPAKIYNLFKKELERKGYTKSVIDDEIQAYLSTEPYKYFLKVKRTVKKPIYNQYRAVLNKYLKTT